jgi:ATP-binding cassette subfamily B protein
VKAFGQEDREQGRFVQRSGEGLRARLKLAVMEGAYGMTIGLTLAIGTALVLFMGVRHVQAGTITLGELLLVMGYVGQLFAPLKTMSRKTARLQGYLASAERAFALLDESPDVVEHPEARPLGRARGEVTFENVSFAYRPSEPILEDMSFHVPAGAQVGVTGTTGAGKTTLVSLLTRFYDPSDGRILLDGVDMREYRLADLRNQFSIVLQEPVLFSTTIAENIAYARPGAAESEIIEAARAAGAHDFIMQLADGYETQVAERGMRLSGGERQRISLARAFLRDAPLLILDEPTSSIDIHTEAAILQTMQRLMKGRTTFLVTHRPATLVHCDAQLVVENGRLVAATGRASGSNVELRSAHG